MAVRDKADQLFYDKKQLGLCMCVNLCVLYVRVYSMHVNVWQRDDRTVCCTVGAECQMVPVNEF